MNDEMGEAMAAVIFEPEHDAPRLHFADVCERIGDAGRAEFIRLEVEMARKARERDPHWYRGTSRAGALIKGHEDEWAGPIARRVRRHSFFGGFVEKIALDASAFLASAEELYHLAPIRRLSLTGVKNVAAELFASSYLTRIVSMTIEDQALGDHEMELLASSPHLGRLGWLDVSGNNITVAGVEALAASRRLPVLKKVDLDGNPSDYLSEHANTDWDGSWHVPIGRHPDVERIEMRYGRKTWLHLVEDHGREDMNEDEL